MFSYKYFSYLGDDFMQIVWFSCGSEIYKESSYYPPVQLICTFPIIGLVTPIGEAYETYYPFLFSVPL